MVSTTRSKTGTLSDAQRRRHARYVERESMKSRARAPAPRPPMRKHRVRMLPPHASSPSTQSPASQPTAPPRMRRRRRILVSSSPPQAAFGTNWNIAVVRTRLVKAATAYDTDPSEDRFSTLCRYARAYWMMRRRLGSEDVATRSMDTALSKYAMVRKHAGVAYTSLSRLLMDDTEKYDEMRAVDVRLRRELAGAERALRICVAEGVRCRCRGEHPQRVAMLKDAAVEGTDDAWDAYTARTRAQERVDKVRADNENRLVDAATAVVDACRLACGLSRGGGASAAAAAAAGGSGTSGSNDDDDESW